LSGHSALADVSAAAATLVIVGYLR
jgi:hypothetical protein